MLSQGLSSDLLGGGGRENFLYCVFGPSKIGERRPPDLQCGGPPNSASVLSGHPVVMSARSTRSLDQDVANPEAQAAAGPKRPSRRPLQSA